MALQDLLKKIQDEANKKAAFMKQVANDEIKKIEEEAAKNAEIRKREIEEKTDEKCASVLKKAKTLAHMESRSQTLREKRELIEQAYASVLRSFNSLKGEEYVSLMVTLLRQAAKEEPKGHLSIPESRRKEMEEAVKKAGVDYQINKEPAHGFESGFVLTSGKIEMNLSLPYLIQKIIRPATELEAAGQLFS